MYNVKDNVCPNYVSWPVIGPYDPWRTEMFLLPVKYCLLMSSMDLTSYTQGDTVVSRIISLSGIYCAM